MLGQRIKELRKEAGLTQAELATYLGIKRSATNSYEQGINAPPPDKLIRIADKFDVSTDYLLGRSSIRKHCDVFDNNQDTKQILHIFIDVFKTDRELIYSGKPLTKSQKNTITGVLRTLETILNEE